MRDFLVSVIPDPGSVIFLLIAALIFYVLFRMLNDARVPGFMDDPVEHDTTVRPPSEPADPEHDARTRGF